MNGNKIYATLSNPKSPVRKKILSEIEDFFMNMKISEIL
jgi:hypothetical protein